MPSRRISVCFLLFCLLLSLTACQGSPVSDPLAYRHSDFSATLSGNREGKDFSCDLICRGGAILSLTYTAPEALNGITLSPAENGWCVKKGALSVTLSEQAIAGLLAPAHALLPQAPTVRSVQKTAQGKQITLVAGNLSCPLTVTLAPSGFPAYLTADPLSLRITRTA